MNPKDARIEAGIETEAETEAKVEIETEIGIEIEAGTRTEKGAEVDIEIEILVETGDGDLGIEIQTKIGGKIGIMKGIEAEKEEGVGPEIGMGEGQDQGKF